jgi:hypothetical protein
MTSLLKVVHSPPLAPRPTAHGRSKIVLTGWITIRGGALGSDHDRRAGRGTGTDEEHYPERRPQRIRIRETIIQGIEIDDYSACGGDFYTRGHIRAIASVAGADPGPLILEFDRTRQAPDTS